MDVNIKHKNSVFTTLFSEEKKLLELYNALSGSNYPLDTHIEITTLSNVLFLDQQNDVSFMIDDKIVVLIEHQSSINENMPIRLLMYMGRVYESILEKDNVYVKKLIKIPKPEFIVLYNGKDKFPPRKTLKLSNAFKEVVTPSIGGSMELEVLVLNINKGFNEDILVKSPDLNGYSTFIAEIRKNQESGMGLKNAMVSAIKTCISENILAQFLENNSSEVENMLFTEFNMDDYLRVAKREAKEEGLEEGLEKGIQKGKLEGLKEIIFNAFNLNLPLEQIANLTGLSPKEIASLKPC